MKVQQRFFGRYIKDIKPGTLTWIGLRPQRRMPMIAVESAMALEQLGLEGDHRCKRTPNSARQVTLISEEYIQQIEHFSGYTPIPPDLLRRNLVVKNLNLTLVRYQRFYIGEALFEATALCHPCSRMDQSVGKGTVAAMLGYGGLCAKVLKSGYIKLGDEVRVIASGN